MIIPLKIANTLEYILKVILFILIILLVFLVFVQIILRYFFSTGIAWSEEMSRFLFIWSTFLAIAVVVKQKANIAFTFLSSKNWIFKPFFHSIYYLASFAFFSIIFYYGIIYTIFGHGCRSSLLPVRMSAFFASVPTCAILSIFFLILQLSDEIINRRVKDKEQ